MFVDDLFNKKTLTENNGGGSPWHSEPEQQQMDVNRRSGLERERNAGLNEPDDAVSGSAPTGNGVYEYTVPAGQESTAQELGLQQHRGHWVSRVPIQRANFQFGRPQFHEIPAKGVAEGSDELYQQAIRKYVHRVANDYLGGGDAHLYGANKFDSEMFGIDPKQAEQDFDKLFPQYVKKLQGGDQGVAEGEKHRINEAVLMEDPVYRKFKGVGRYIAERRMSEKEILQVFADAEAGMTDKGTGANRTMLGRGKDNTMAFAGSVKDAVTSVLSSIQNSVPVSAVDVAYDQATDALAGLSGGQRGKVMQAIKGYRNLVKEYPKASGFAKAALVAIAGLATGGAGLPAIAGLTYALDSAIRGDKLSSVLGKGVGASAVTWGGQQAVGALTGSTAAGSTVPADQSLVPGETVVGPDNQINVPDKYADGLSKFDQIVSNAVDYKVKPGDTLSEILADRKINPEAFKRLPGNEVFFSPDGNPNILKAGQTIKLPDPADVADLNRMSYTTPSNYERFDKEYDTTGYTGQYNQNSAFGLDAANNLKQQGFGRLGADDGIAAARVAKDAGGQAANLGPASLGPTNLGPNFNPDNIPPGWTMKQAPSPIDATGGTTQRYIPQNDGTWIDASTGKVADAAKLQASQDAVRNALRTGFKESIKFKILPVDRLIDRQGTVISWALQESIGVKRKSVNLTTTGAYTVFENVDRYRQAIMEKAGVPGSTRPAYYRPDMSGGPGKKSKPGIIGRGLNWLDRTAGKVGGALSNFGHQFTTNVTKEKLKMNWHQAGKPSDSDQLAAFLTKQGVPQEVVATVYGKMSIPYTAPVVEPKAQPATDPAATGKSGIQTGATALIDPDTKRPYEKDKLAAMYGYKEPVAPTAGAAKTPAASTTSAVAANPAGFNAGNVMKLPGMEKYAKPAAPAKTANFAGPSGYGKITTSFKPPAAPSSPALAVPKAPAAPTAPKVTAGGPTPAEKAKLDKRIAAAAAAPAVAETIAQIERMLESVNSKKSAEMVKAYVDQKFTELGLRNTTECRNIMAHVVQESAIRRRQYAKSLAN